MDKTSPPTGIKPGTPGYTQLTFQRATQEDQPQMVKVMSPTIGFCLILLGLIVMGASMWQVYKVFTKQVEPVKMFNFEGIKLDPSQFAPKMLNQSPELIELQKKFNVSFESLATGNSESKPVEVIPAAVLNDSANLSAFMFLMGFILNFGYKIASLGVKMIRPVYVKA